MSSATRADLRSFLVVRGARQHNLGDVTVRIPHRALTVVTGVSGSGKSSLAVDTLFAEGQRRFLEGVAPHARRFLDRIPRPDVDGIEGLLPAVRLEQHGRRGGARSTVATASGTHDFLRLLFARAGRVHCPRCGAEAPRWTVARIAARHAGEERLVVTFPFPVGRGGEDAAVERLRTRGYLRAMWGGRAGDLVEDRPPPGEWDVLQDRVPRGRPDRLIEAVEAALREGEGRVGVGGPERRTMYRLGRSCAECGEAVADPEPHHFSFNSPLGACPACRGFGDVLVFDPEKAVPRPDLTLDGGALHPFAGRWRGWFRRRLEASPRARLVPRDVPWRDLDAASRALLLEGDGRFPGVAGFLARLERKAYKASARFVLRRYQSRSVCPRCRGDRLGDVGRSVRVDGASLPEWLRLPIGDARARLRGVAWSNEERETGVRLLAELDHRLEVLERVGLDYLALDRPMSSLSGGEAQRIELAQALGGRLVRTLYVLDEPTVGLHPRDTDRLLRVLRDLVRLDNTVVVVEHDADVIAAADWVLELGPGAGEEGGRVLAEGPPPAPVVEPRPRSERRAPAPGGPGLTIHGAVLHNLRDVTVSFPARALTGVCGVSGSGKSTLVAATLAPLAAAAVAEGRRRIDRPGLGRLDLDVELGGVTVVDQSPLARSSRSIPASYSGAWSGIRALFASLPEARRRGWTAGRFSFNVRGGRCETCAGEGETTIDMDFMPDVRVPCEACRGTRFAPETGEVRYRGLGVVEVLDLSVDRALALFEDRPAVARPLGWLQRVGLGYLRLGQDAASLSGGEAQRLKLVRELAAGGPARLFVLDEPTVGLHASEVRRLVEILLEMTDAGHTLVAVEHHTGFLGACDRLVELGPGGGREGGHLVAAGTPAEVAKTDGSPTAPWLGRAGFRTESTIRT